MISEGVAAGSGPSFARRAATSAGRSVSASMIVHAGFVGLHAAAAGKRSPWPWAMIRDFAGAVGGLAVSTLWIFGDATSFDKMAGCQGAVTAAHDRV